MIGQLITGLLGQPIAQFGGLAGILWGLHRAGLIDVKKGFQSALGITSAANDVTADNNAGMQTVLSSLENRMTELSQYANHDTTARLDMLHEKVESGIRTQERTNRLLEEIKEYGIKCRKE